jgi:hypothetical protein
MIERDDLDEILARNPGVDLEKLAEWSQMLRTLRERGIRRKGYDLAPHSGGHRASFQDRSYSDLRLTRRGERGKTP